MNREKLGAASAGTLGGGGQVDPLQLFHPSAEAWNRFARGMSATDAATRQLFARWQRSADLRVPSADLPQEEGLLRGPGLREQQEALAPLAREGAPLIARAASALSQRHFVLLLADSVGRVVQAVGGGGFSDQARAVRLIPGADWSEARRGTNAIGTALTEARPVAVVGGAHYVRDFGQLVCYAAPVRDPEGRVVAVLDATGHLDQADPAVAALVVSTAAALEAALQAMAWRSLGEAAAGLMERTLDRLREPAVLLQAPGRVVRWNPAAQQACGGKPSLEQLGLTWRALVAAGAGGVVPLRWPLTAAAVARVEPMLDAQGHWVGAALIQEPEARVKPLAAPPRSDDSFGALYAEDPGTALAVSLARRVARSRLPVLLLAETGCGKERFAEAIHRESERRDGPFVPVNCGSFAPELWAAELFGYGPGAFTGADRAGRDGLLASAEGGTLFLDELAEMPPPMQVALLRVLEDGRYERVGERAPRQARVRVIGATCRDLAALVEQGSFRRDLWFRLKGVVIRIPPLRERTDRLGLARALLRRDRGPDPELSPDLQAWILGHDWPGNVRELRSVLEVAEVLSEGAPVLGLEHLPPDLCADRPRSEGPSPAESLEAAQVSAIRRALEATAGNVSAAARRLGIARSTVYRVLGRQPR